MSQILIKQCFGIKVSQILIRRCFGIISVSNIDKTMATLYLIMNNFNIQLSTNANFNIPKLACKLFTIQT